eukprot:symbB.v1.2.011914.t5/scaffold794.1/size161992/7
MGVLIGWQSARQTGRHDPCAYVQGRSSQGQRSRQLSPTPVAATPALRRQRESRRGGCLFGYRYDSMTRCLDHFSHKSSSFMAPRHLKSACWVLIFLSLIILLTTPKKGFALHAERPSNQQEWWRSPAVLCVQCDDNGLSEQLVNFCRALERQSRGRTVSNRGGWQSNDLIALDAPELQELMKMVQEPAKTFLAQQWTYPEDDEDLEVSVLPDQLWANINRPGDWNARHTHGSPSASLFASGVFYPAEVRGRTLPAHLVLYPGNASTIRVLPEPNLLVLFPPDMPHEVEQSDASSEERVSIAFNLAARWLPGDLLQAAYQGDAGKVSQFAADKTDRLLGLSAAHLAAEQGHVAVLKALRGKTNLSAMSTLGTPLQLAASRGHEMAVEYLMGEAPASAAAALAAAAQRGHAKVVSALSRVAGNQASAGLKAAAISGHAEVVEDLLSNPGLVETPDARVGMMEAATRGHSEVIDVFLAAGADIHASDSSGKTALHNAAAGGHLNVVRLLVGHGPDSLSSRDKQDAEPLHWAALQGHAAVVEELVAAGADVNAVALGSVPGRPLHWAARSQSADVVQALLRLGAQVGTSEVRKSIQPPFPGEVLVRSGDVLAGTHSAEVLSKRGVPASAAGEDGTSPLHIAARMGDQIIAALLSSSGAELNVRDYTGGTPLHWAAANGHANLTADLLSRGANPDSVDLSDGTPLHDAAWAGHDAVAQVLLASGASVNAKDAKGRSPLHAAALLSQPEVVELLLASGAEDLPDDQDQYPVDLAFQAAEWVDLISKTMSTYGDAMRRRASRVLELLQEKSTKKGLLFTDAWQGPGLAYYAASPCAADRSVSPENRTIVGMQVRNSSNSPEMRRSPVAYSVDKYRAMSPSPSTQGLGVVRPTEPVLQHVRDRSSSPTANARFAPAPLVPPFVQGHSGCLGALVELIARLQDHFKEEFNAREKKGQGEKNKLDLEASCEWMRTFFGAFEELDGDTATGHVGLLVFPEMMQTMDRIEKEQRLVRTEDLPGVNALHGFVSLIYNAEQLTKTGDPLSYERFVLHGWLLRAIELDRMSRRQQRLCRVVNIIDVTGCTLSKVICKEFDQRAEKMMQRLEKLVPDLTAGNWVINAPWIMQKIFPWAKRTLKIKEENDQLDADFHYIKRGQVLEKALEVSSGSRDHPPAMVVEDGGALDLVSGDFEDDSDYEGLREEVLRDFDTWKAVDGEHQGEVVAPKSGLVVLRWSNEFNILRAKRVQFEVGMEELKASTST